MSTNLGSPPISVPSAVSAPQLAESPFRSSIDFIQYVLKNFLGLDPLWAVNAGLGLAAVTALWRWLRDDLYFNAKSWVFSKVVIQQEDALYHDVLQWMTDNHLPAQQSRNAQAVTLKATTLEDDEAALELFEKTSGLESSPTSSGKGKGKLTTKLINYRRIIGQQPVEFQFDQVSRLIRHKGRFFWFEHQRDRNSQAFDIYAARQAASGLCSISIECFGRSVEPIKQLIIDAQAHRLAKPASTVRICKDSLYDSRYVDRPARSIDTVILDETQKFALLADINKYLHPRTRRWYAEHGIPYRRGYLLSGPPGTGKSSLSTAIAGLFGLQLNLIDLSQADDDYNLSQVFDNLPSRCIALLEDVDAAGIKREGDEIDDDIDLSTFARRNRRRRSRNGVTLSGLLNVLDGVASQEGRIVIMTTNCPERLDEALLRPGRVDMHVRFKLPLRSEMRDLFLSMYRNLAKDAASSPSSAANPTPGATSTSKTSSVSLSGVSDEKTPTYTTASLEALADVFADSLPERTLSFATIQGYLLQHQDNPASAVEHVAAWEVQQAADRARQQVKMKAKEEAEAKRVELAKAKARLKVAKAEAQTKKDLAELEETLRNGGDAAGKTVAFGGILGGNSSGSGSESVRSEDVERELGRLRVEDGSDSDDEARSDDEYGEKEEESDG